MAYLNTLRAGIQQGSIIQASHVTELYDALSGTGSLGISVIGSSAIGTATPVAGAMLTVNGEQRLFGNLVFGADDTEYFIRPVTYGGAIRLRGDGNNSADRALQFGYIDNSNVWGSLMTLKESGFLGIGITNPTQKLHVLSGSVIADNYLYNGKDATAQVAHSSYISHPIGIFLSTSSFTDICYVGGAAQSLTRFTFRGGGGDSVIAVIADVIVNHQKDVYVQTQGGAYDALQLRIKPLVDSGSNPAANTQGEYVLQVKQEFASANFNRLNVIAITEPTSTVLFSGSFNGGALNYSQHVHDHTCYPGMHISSTDGDIPLNEGMFGVSRRISIGATASADHESSRTWTMWVQGKANDSLMLITGSTAGNRRFHIDSIGRVGIGTTPYIAGGFHTLTVGANELNSAGLVKLRSTYNNGDGAEILQDPSNGTITFNFNSTTSSLYLTTGSGGVGRVGIGLINPSSSLHVRTTTVPSTGETIAQFDVSDDSSYLRISNSTVADNTFIPTLEGYNSTEKIAMYFLAVGTTDTGTEPLLRYDARIGAAQVVTRPLFQWSNFGDVKMTMSGNGNVGIGTVSPSVQLELSTDNAKKSSTATWLTTSDIRLKENIEEANYDTCYDVIKNLPLKRYTWKDTVYTTQQVADRSKLGWIAQDVQSVFPKAVTSSSFSGSGDFYLDDCLSLNADQIYAAMYGTVKKLIVENESLKLQVSASNAEIQAIKTHLGL